jgi:hypothetical protein
MYNTPGKAAAIHPSRGDALAFFAFRTPAVPDFDYRDTAQHKRLLTAAFEDGPGGCPSSCGACALPTTCISTR